MKIPNCVPEYYREQEERANDEYERAYRAWESVEGYSEINDYDACSCCAGCQYMKIINIEDIYEPCKAFCTVEPCIHTGEERCYCCGYFIEHGDLLEYRDKKMHIDCYNNTSNQELDKSIDSSLYMRCCICNELILVKEGIIQEGYFSMHRDCYNNADKDTLEEMLNNDVPF